jgi:CheY-like chemotaxis protein
MAEVRPGHATGEFDRLEHRATVLLVDDDSAVRSAVNDFLDEEGFAIVSATNGSEALNILQAGLRPNVILLDVLMPVMDGWDFRATQLANPLLRDIPVIVMSASGFGHGTICHQLNATDVLAKPLELGLLLETLRRVCGLENPGQSSSNSSA